MLKLRLAAIVVGAFLMAACAQRPVQSVPPGPAPAPTITVPTSIREGATVRLRTTRTADGYRIAISEDGAALRPIATSGRPLVFPTLVDSENVAYVDFLGPRARFVVQELASGRQEYLVRGVYTDCIADANLSPVESDGRVVAWNDDRTSQPLGESCRGALLAAYAKVRLTAAMRLVSEDSVVKAKAELVRLKMRYAKQLGEATMTYRIGVAEYFAKDYASASANFRRAAEIATSPDLASDAILAARDCQAELGKPFELDPALVAIADRYPQTPAGRLAQQQRTRGKSGASDSVLKTMHWPSPRFAWFPEIAYPPLSRRFGEQGRVMVQVNVQTDGIPVKTTLVKSSSFARLDEEAMQMVERMRFFPARTATGVKVDASTTAPLNFVLSN